MADHQSIPNALLICRYWALGSECPNINARGENVCKFAHRDTGNRLASEFQQRGTCQGWLNGTCEKGHTCWYEHRTTGLVGMYQGSYPLRGFNVEVAEALAKAGFDTWNHSALFDLIWAVRRVALRHSKPPNRTIPHKDPLYPDRYRPSGVGDNTNKRRPDVSIGESIAKKRSRPDEDAPNSFAVKVEENSLARRAFQTQSTHRFVIENEQTTWSLDNQPASKRRKLDEDGSTTAQHLRVSSPTSQVPRALDSVRPTFTRDFR